MAGLFTVSVAGYQSPTKPPNSYQELADLLKLSAAEERDTYDIYSAVLREKKPSIAIWKIVSETRPFKFCLKPTQDLVAIYRPVLDDYSEKNKSKLILERKFDLSAYTMEPAQEWFGSGGSPELVTLSAVGFNIDRTRAGVCYSVGTSAGGSWGTCLFLVKQGGKWKDDRDDHEGCGFGGGVFR
jgi:hypothetical protein